MVGIGNVHGLAIGDSHNLGVRGDQAWAGQGGDGPDALPDRALERLASRLDLNLPSFLVAPP